MRVWSFGRSDARHLGTGQWAQAQEKLCGQGRGQSAHTDIAVRRGDGFIIGCTDNRRARKLEQSIYFDSKLSQCAYTVPGTIIRCAKNTPFVAMCRVRFCLCHACAIRCDAACPVDFQMYYRCEFLTIFAVGNEAHFTYSMS